MNYKATRTILTVVFPLVGLLFTLAIGVYTQKPEYEIIIMVSVSYLPWTVLGWLCWSVYRIHFLGRMLDHTSLTAKNIKSIYGLTGSFKYHKEMHQVELDDIVDLALEELEERISSDSLELKTFIQASVCIHYNFLWLGENCSGLEEMNRMTESYYDKINIDLQLQLRNAMKNNPLEVSNVTLADVKWPKVITDAIEKQQERELAIKTEENEQAIAMVKKTNQLAQVNADREIEITKAITIRDQNRLISEGISANLLAYKALEVQEKMAGNERAVFVPYESLNQPGLSNRIYGK